MCRKMNADLMSASRAKSNIEKRAPKSVVICDAPNKRSRRLPRRMDPHPLGIMPISTDWIAIDGGTWIIARNNRKIVFLDIIRCNHRVEKALPFFGL